MASRTKRDRMKARASAQPVASSRNEHREPRTPSGEGMLDRLYAADRDPDDGTDFVASYPVWTSA